MLSQRSGLFSYLVKISVILNVSIVLHYVNGNDQTLIVPFPNGTSVAEHPDEELVQLRMQGAKTEEPNTLVCTGFTLPPDDHFWIKQIKGVVGQSNIVMNLYGCSSTVGNPCSCPLPDRSLLYSWNRFTPPIRFGSTSSPAGFNVGGDSQIAILFLEIKYGDTVTSPDSSNGFDVQITRVKPLYVASIYSLLVPGNIPPNKNSFTFDACVTVPTHPNPIKMLAFRTNAAKYGVLASGYLINRSTGVITELGRGNPTFPQAFYAAPQLTQLNAGDTIMVRCVFDSVNGFVGSTAARHACIYNIMWITQYPGPAITTSSHLKGLCTDDQRAKFPASSTTLLPDNPKLVMHALYGNQSGIVEIDSTQSVNLDLETYTTLLP